MDSPLSREGAFLANNVVFAVFAFVVLLGTVFPLIVEAPQDRRTVVGAPYFDRLAMPIGIALLFLMAVAPVLPWRKASAGAAARPPVLAGVVRRRRARLGGVVGRRRLGPAGGVRPGGLRRRRRAASGGAGDTPPRLARSRRSRQRRDDRPPRCDPDRGGAGGVERLHQVGRPDPAPRRDHRVGGPHVRVESTSSTSSPIGPR